MYFPTNSFNAITNSMLNPNLAKPEFINLIKAVPNNMLLDTYAFQKVLKHVEFMTSEEIFRRMGVAQSIITAQTRLVNPAKITPFAEGYFTPKFTPSNINRLLNFREDPERVLRRERLHKLFFNINEVKEAVSSKNLSKARSLILKHLGMQFKYLESIELDNFSSDSILMKPDERRQEFFAVFFEAYSELNKMTYPQLMAIQEPPSVWLRKKFRVIFTARHTQRRDFPGCRITEFNSEVIYRDYESLPSMDINLIEQEYKSALCILAHEAISRLKRLNSHAATRRLLMLEHLLDGSDFKDLSQKFSPDDIRRLKGDLQKANKKTGLISTENKLIEIVKRVPLI